MTDDGENYEPQSAPRLRVDSFDNNYVYVTDDPQVGSGRLYHSPTSTLLEIEHSDYIQVIPHWSNNGVELYSALRSNGDVDLISVTASECVVENILEGVKLLVRDGNLMGGYACLTEDDIWDWIRIEDRDNFSIYDIDVDGLPSLEEIERVQTGVIITKSKVFVVHNNVSYTNKNQIIPTNIRGQGLVRAHFERRLLYLLYGGGRIMIRSGKKFNDNADELMSTYNRLGKQHRWIDLVGINPIDKDYRLHWIKANHIIQLSPGMFSNKSSYVKNARTKIEV